MDIFDSTIGIKNVSDVKEATSKSERYYKFLSKKSMNETILGGHTPEDKFLNKISDGISQIKAGYWFGGEAETENSLVLEFLSTQAPTIRIFIERKELQKYFRKE